MNSSMKPRARSGPRARCARDVGRGGSLRTGSGWICPVPACSVPACSVTVWLRDRLLHARRLRDRRLRDRRLRDCRFRDGLLGAGLRCHADSPSPAVRDHHAASVESRPTRVGRSSAPAGPWMPPAGPSGVRAQGDPGDRSHPASPARGRRPAGAASRSSRRRRGPRRRRGAGGRRSCRRRASCAWSGRGGSVGLPGVAAVLARRGVPRGVPRPRTTR